MIDCHTALRHAPVAALLLNKDRRIQFCNQRAATLLGGAEPADLLEVTLYASPDAGIPSSGLDIASLITADAVVTQRSTWSLPRRNAISYECTCVPVAGAEGNPASLLVFVDDEEDKVRLERAKLQADKLTALDNIVGGIAHELNNPMTAILGYTELLLSKNLDMEVRTRLDTIQEKADRCRRIVQGLMQFAQRNSTSLAVGSVNAILVEIAGLCKYQLSTDDITLELSLDEALPPVPLQRDSLQSMFLGLINNAHQALCTVEGRARKLIISTQCVESMIQVSFEDNGPGIPEDIQPKVFDPFFTTRTFGEGMGLGLSIGYGVAREHGGCLRLESTPGVGTRLILELPFYPAG